jgi:hypothetical protein
MEHVHIRRVVQIGNTKQFFCFRHALVPSAPKSGFSHRAGSRRS